MMRDIYEGVLEVLDIGTSEEKAFNVVTSKVMHSEPYQYMNDKLDISHFAGAILRHYLAYSRVINLEYPTLDDKTKYTIMFVFVNTHFLYRYKQHDILDILRSRLYKNGYADKVMDIQNFVKSFKTFDSILQYKTKKVDWIEKISCRTNIPRPVINFWNMEFGKKCANGLAWKTLNNTKTYVLLNPLSKPNGHVDYEKKLFNTTDKKDLFTFKKDKTFVTSIYYKKRFFVPSCPEFYSMARDLEFDPLKPVAFYADEPTDFITTLGVYYKDSLKVSVLTPKENYYPIKDELKASNIKNTHVYTNTGYDSFDVNLSEKVSTFIVFAKNSSLRKLSTDPFFFLRAQGYRTIHSNRQYLVDLLTEASRHVLSGGRIIYYLDTCSKEELDFVVKDFISKNKDFYVKEDKSKRHQETKLLNYLVISKRKD